MSQSFGLTARVSQDLAGGGAGQGAGADRPACGGPLALNFWLLGQRAHPGLGTGPEEDTKDSVFSGSQMMVVKQDQPLEVLEDPELKTLDGWGSQGQGEAAVESERALPERSGHGASAGLPPAPAGLKSVVGAGLQPQGALLGAALPDTGK